mmetsp:Transcript_24775/g.27567  ORF Transcript_24775/g.27567 Transcript_24775/m.27567 type:complete len:129 (+) Transcript_24775:145-531(+)
MAAQGTVPIDNRTEILKKVLTLLPEDNRATFKALSSLLHEIDKKAKYNQMNARSLAEAFAPLLLGDPETITESESLGSEKSGKPSLTENEIEKYMLKEEDILHTLIKYHPLFWDEKHAQENEEKGEET